jgi:general transcription factor 3C polypeptide 5 (transcription factor C subunit 1)
VDNHSVEAVGMVRETHRFRTLPDFQLRNADLPVMRQIRDHVMVPDYEKLRKFEINLGPTPSVITAFPGPPAFTSMDMPYKYDYEQAAGVIFEKDETGNLISKNLSAPPRRLIWALAPDCPDEEIPQKAPMEIPKRSPGGEMLPRAIDELQKLMDKRPLITKRVAINALPNISESIFKEATQFVGYSFRAGPWRDSLIRYGVDPRKDPKYRFYQTMMFQVDREAFKNAPEGKSAEGKLTAEHKAMWARTLRHKKDDPTTHIFDGKNITANGKTWQVCDVTDPVVHGIFHTEDIRPECDVYQWGWYWNGTMSKARTIMKDKMRYLFAGQTPPDEDYVAVASLPNNIFRGAHNDTYLNAKEYGAHASAMSMEVRYNAKNGDNAKALVMSTREGFASGGAEEAGEDGADADMIDGELDGMAENAADEDGPGDFADMENQAELGEDDGNANASEQNEHKT